MQYFKGLPLPEEHMMELEDGGNEAEWIVDITTQADRQNRHYSHLPFDPPALTLIQ